MSIPAPNPQTFDWIKGALDGSMTTVMSEVTQAEKESNYARLTTVPGNLHQIYGSLKMVELDAAGMLAEDLEKLCMLICDSIETEPSEQHKNIKLLRRGLESLQGYIDSVSRQTPVSPLSLVDQINQVREVTGGKQVSRFDLFDPPLGRLSFDNQDNEAPIPAPARSRAVPDDIRVRLVTQLRRKYRRALLSWLAIRNKNDGSEEYLEKINDLLQHLFRISSLDISQQLWWVASGFVDAVASGDLGPDKRIKSQFARLDIEISRLEQDSTAGIATNPPDELLRQMLFFLGPLKDPESDRIRQIQKALDLPQWFGTDSEDYEQLVKLSRSLNQIRENFDSHKFDQIESLMSEFFAGSTDTPGNAGSDALDSALNELLERAEQAELEPMFKLVRQIKDTATTTEKTADALSLTAADIKIASALLFVRDSIANAESLDATWEHSVNSYLEELQALSAQTEKSKDRAVQIRKVAEVEYHHARSAASSQIKEALSQIEDALAQFESDENEIDPAQLQFATDQLHQIANLFSIVDHSSAAKLSQKVAKSLTLVLNNELHLNQPIIEQLAFAVAAIGAGADYLAKRGPDARKVLQKALKYLDKAVKRELARKDDQEGAGSQQQKTFVTSIAKIDLYRQQLAVGDTSSVGKLIDVFSTLESGLGLEQGKTISDLSKLGRELCLFLTDVEKSLNSDHEDFIGLLARQLKELSVSKCDVDLEAWQERFDSLMTVNAGKSLAEQSDTSLGGSADRESGTGFDSSSSFTANNNSAEGERVSDIVEQSSIVDLQAELAAVSASLKDIDFADEYSQPPDDAIELDADASASISEVEKIGNEFSLFEKKEESEIVSTDDSDDTELNLPEESLQALEEGLTQQNQVEVSKGGDFDLLDERNEFSETDFSLPNEVEELSEADFKLLDEQHEGGADASEPDEVETLSESDFKLLDEQHEAGADASEPDEVETLSESDFKLHVEREPESETESIKLSEAEDIAEADFKSLEGQEQEEEPDSAMLVQLDQDLKSIFVNEFAAHLERLEQDIVKISDRAHKSEVPLNDIISDIEECIHTLSGNCRNLGFDEAAECAESGVKRLRQEFGTEFESESVSHFREGILLLRQALDQISDKGNYDKDLGGRFLASHYSSEQALERSDTTSAPNGSSIIIDESLNELDTQQGIDSVAVESSNKESSRQESTWDTGQPSSTIAEFSEQESAEVPVSVSEAGAGDAEIDEEIRQIFLEETEGILERINNHLIEWREQGLVPGVLAGIRREFHTLKGSAAATGFEEVSGLSHSVETLLDKSRPDPDEDNSEILNLLEETHDGLAADLGFMTSGSKGYLATLHRMVLEMLTPEGMEECEVFDQKTAKQPNERGIDASDELLTSKEVEVSTLERAPTTSKSATSGPGIKETLKQSEFDSVKEDQDDNQGIDQIMENHESWMPKKSKLDQAGGVSEDASSGASLKIDNTKLADLINASGELSLVRTQLQNTLDATRMDLDVLRASMSSMRAGLRELEIEADAQIRARPEQQAANVDEDFDPLQLDRYSRLQAKSREVTEMLDQLAKVERDLDNRTSNFGGVLQQQSHLGDQLQSGLMSARMVSVGDSLPRLRYLVRETSKQANKKIELEFHGGDIQVDRQVIETMMAPFEHMIRNAVIHGIENTDDRVQSGKSETGRISVSMAQQGSELVIEFFDDGRGLDTEKLSARAVELGLVDSKSNVSVVEFLQIITQPGYSTSDSLSMESGRGVGMDVVYQAVRDLGGSMTLSNRPGNGVTFQFRLPVSLAVTQALLVRVVNWSFAIRSRSIERLMRVPVAEVLEQEAQRMIVIDDLKMPLLSIRERLGESAYPGKQNYVSVVLVRLADRLAAFEVDQFKDSVNIVSKSPGKQLDSIPEIAGVTVLGDSSIVLILDPESFIDRIAPLEDSSHHIDQDIARAPSLRRVLVVDDSLVVRKVMQRDLEADGLEVETAIDGFNALEILENSTFDIALVDIEMPRMNGYELLEKLRQDSRFGDLPIIIITSRSGSQHKKRAVELGAEGYITKPYDISALDQLMRQVVDNKRKVH